MIMKTKIFTLLFAIVTSIGTISAWTYEHVQVGDLYYNIDDVTQQAEVTYEKSNDNNNYTSLANVVVPPSINYGEQNYSVTSIGNDAFYKCLTLVSITMSDNIVSVGQNAFCNCTHLKEVTLSGNLEEIVFKTFGYCVSLESIVIPDNVISIDRYAFAGCELLSEIVIGENVTKIDLNAFVSCNQIKSVLWKPRKCDCKYLFKGKTTIESFILGEKVEEIPEYLCQGLNKIPYIIIPNSVKKIGAAAFYGCSGVRSLTIGNNVDTIGENAFRECKMDSLVIPSNVECIEGCAFMNCSALKSITICNKISLNGWVFATCGSLEEIIFLNETPPLKCNTTTFYGTGNCPIYVPCGSKNQYIYWAVYTVNIESPH